MSLAFSEGRLPRAFLIVSSLSPRGLPRAEASNGIAPLHEARDEHALLVRLSDDDLPRFGTGVVGIVEDPGESIGEHRERLLERHPVLGFVNACLFRIPLEPQVHPAPPPQPRASSVPQDGPHSRPWPWLATQLSSGGGSRAYELWKASGPADCCSAWFGRSLA